MKRDYELIDQKPYCCVGACLEMLLKRNNIPCGSQEEILENFPKREIKGYDGIKLTSITDMNKQFFLPNEVPLREKYISYSQIRSWDSYLTDFMDYFLNSDNDIMLFTNFIRVCNDSNIINNTIDSNDKTLNMVHCFLVSDIIDENHIYLISPDTTKNDGTKIIETTTRRIYDSFYYTIDKAGLGYSVITKKLP